MANVALICPLQAPPQQDMLDLKDFPFLSLPPEIRAIIYELAIFPDDTSEFFVVNPMLRLSLLRVCKVVSREASAVLYTKRVAVISFLSDQYYLHGRTKPLEQLFRAVEDSDSTQESIEAVITHNEARPRLLGHIRPDILVRFQKIRLCLFFKAVFPVIFRQKRFDSQEELKRIIEVLRDHSPTAEHTFPGKPSLEIIVATNPKRPRNEDVETSRESRVRENFVSLGIPDALKEVKKRRMLKVGGDFTRQGLVNFCEVTCGNRK